MSPLTTRVMRNPIDWQLTPTPLERRYGREFKIRAISTLAFKPCSITPANYADLMLINLAN